jgi:hypothetical protein
MLAPAVLALSLIVRVYDNVGVPAGEMGSARAAAQHVLSDAGIAVSWRECPRGTCEDLGPPAPAEIVMRVVVAPPAWPFGSLGFSVVDVERRSGTLATVFVDRVRDLSALAGADSGLLLGRAMAHEIGHLLLGTTHHTDRGLMRGLWTTIDLQKEQPWDWVVSREDGARMRRALAARLRRLEQPAAIVARK